LINIDADCLIWYYHDLYGTGRSDFCLVDKAMIHKWANWATICITRSESTKDMVTNQLINLR
jgi:hypothetical protein